MIKIVSKIISKVSLRISLTVVIKVRRIVDEEEWLKVKMMAFRGEIVLIIVLIKIEEIRKSVRVKLQGKVMKMLIEEIVLIKREEMKRISLKVKMRVLIKMSKEEMIEEMI